MTRKLLAVFGAILLLATMVVPGVARVNQPPANAAVPDAAPASPVDQTKVPHYFGPYPNWANSPLTAPDATVIITGDGTGASAVATVGANGAITDITLTDGGQGYSNAKVDIISATGTGATADATIVKKGAVVSVSVDTAGGGYTAPAIAFSSGAAAATAFGGVDGVAVTIDGAKYSFPTVDFDLPDDPAGIQAHGHATCAAPYLDCTGAPDMGLLAVTGIVVDDPGSGYLTAPGVTVRDGTQFDPINPPTGFVPVSATATLKVLSIVVDAPGADYTSAPTVAISDLTGTGLDATATATIDNGVISAISLKKAGSGYVTAGGIKKFVDTLPGLTPAGINNLGQYIPLAVPDTTTFPDNPLTTTVNEGADYYVIGVVQHRERMSSSLPAAGTLLREYVQLASPGTPATIPLVQDNFDGSTSPIMMPDGITQAVGVDNPHYLGPTIVASKDRAVRIVFYNLLPKGAEGNLFLPTDTSLMGSGPNADALPMMTDPTGAGTVMDEIRNPMCTYNPQMPDCYSQNRATLHLHGGVTPWISDGTPHQWITPAGDGATYPQGVSVQNVPDMLDNPADPTSVMCKAAGDGCQTFYYTNQQSARLMFYHDHAWGITRLNVYAGEAAGYVLTDATEQKLIGTGGALAGLGVGTPLVIQDRTFVPSAAQLAGQDPTWDSSKWGGMGNLWYHHVYMPAQNPGDPSGMSAYGRWMYGPWFWPPATPQDAPIKNPYYNMDPNAVPPFSAPLAVPCNLDNPNTWQYQVEPFCEPQYIPGTPNISVGMEQFNDTPLVNGTAYPTTTVDPKSYRFRILNAANDRFWNLSWYVADASGTEVALKASEVAAAQTDINIVPTPDETLSAKGPSWIQIGSEGGFLPMPTVVPPQPTTWITDPTRFDVGNVDKHSLLLAPAERGDVVVDFSKYAGKTLILYNDAPAAFPARVASYDYYTGGPDTGAGVVLPGYGPNTRTIMQVKVAANGAAPAFNLTALNNAFKHHADGSGVFESGSDPIIVGQAAYNAAYGKSFVASGNCTDPNGTNKCDGLARINQQGGDQFRFDTLKGPQLKVGIEPKALHDEMNSAAFDEYGRMTANLGLEAVPATPAGQNIFLYPYIAPPTEVIDGTNLPKGDIKVQPISSGADGTQIWKITHNGVDTHPIHFHLFNVQLLNRVTWDNIIIPTEPSELGWKETIRVSPLEDTIVAVRAITPAVPFEVPNSIRPLSPMMPLGVDLNEAQLIVDPNNNVTTIANALVNFGWEYVYHCHILSHEEMDMMRPVLYALPPLAPGSLVFATGTLTFNDNSITETSFVVQKSLDGTTWAPVPDPTGAMNSPLNLPNGHGVRSLVDPAFDSLVTTSYRVLALNMVGAADSAVTGFASKTVQSASPTLVVGLLTPTTTALTSDINPSTFGQNVTFTATVTATTGIPTGSVQFSIDGANVGAPVALNAAGVATYSTSTLAIGSHSVQAVYNGSSFYDTSLSNTLTQVVNTAPTTTTLTTSLNPSFLGQSVTFTATVSPTAATGSVDFNIDSVVVASVPLVAGQATYSTSTLLAGDHPVIATYSGNATYNTSNATLTQTVSPLIATTTGLTSSLNPSTFGQNVTFTATVSPAAATGTVVFTIDHGVPSAPIALNASGVASLPPVSLPAGSHSVVATYSGSATYATSFGTLAQAVNKAATTTTVQTSDNNGRVGNQLRLTATTNVVAPGAGTRTGNVEFKLTAGTTTIVIGTQAVGTNGVTVFNWTPTPAQVGTWTIVATYSGDANFLGSSGTRTNQRVR